MKERVPFFEERGRNENQNSQKERGRNGITKIEERKKERFRSFSRSFQEKKSSHFDKTSIFFLKIDKKSFEKYLLKIVFEIYPHFGQKCERQIGFR